MAHRSNNPHLSALLLTLALLTPTTAAAQGAPASQPAAPASQPSPMDRARAMYNEAQVEYRLGHFKLAMALYEQALKLTVKPSLIFNIAQCHYQLRRWHRALFHYKHYLAVWAKHHPERAAPNLAGVHAKIAKIQLILERKKQHDGKTPIVVKPSTTVVIQGDKKTAPKAPKHALLRIGGLAISGARVLVDGKLKAVAPIEHLLKVKPGVRKVAVTANGYIPWRQEVNAVLGKEALVPVDLQPVPTRSKLWLGLTISSLVLAAGAEAMAIIFHVQAEEHIAGTKAFEDDKGMVTLGHALAGGLAALAAVPLYFYLTSNSVDAPSEEKGEPGGGRREALRAGDHWRGSVSASFAPLPGGGVALGQVRF